MDASLKRFAAGWLLIGMTLAASGATESPPQLQIKSGGPSQVALSWPAPAEDFLLEETQQLSSLSRWFPVAQAPAVSDGWCTVDMPCTEPVRFFRLRYEPSALRSSQSAISFALVGPDGGSVASGQPFSIELRASFNAVLAAAAVRISASGSAEAMLTGRSANPVQSNGLMFVSSTSQEPFESGLPVSLTGEGSLDVLLGGGAWPFDGALPGDHVLLERLEVTPTTDGDLTISLAGAEAVTSRWAQDGVFFDWVGINPWSSAVTVNVGGAGVRAGAGVGAPSTVRTSGQREQPAQEINPNADGQGGVDLADLVYVRARLGLDPALPENAGADANQDNAIDLLDLVAVRNRFTSPFGPDDPPEARLNEVCSSPAGGEAPWVELKCPRLVDNVFTTLELRNGSQEVLLAPWGEPIPGWFPFILIVFDGEQPMEYLEGSIGVKLHLANPGTVFNPASDQCLLYLDGELVDSVEWGHVPERNAALNTELYPVPSGGSIGRDGYEQDRWVRFGQPSPGADNGLPSPLAFFPIPGGGVLQGETTEFSWVDPRYACVAYELEVYGEEDLQTPLLHVVCQKAGYSHSPGLALGKYFWRVRPVAGDLQGPWSALQEFEVLEVPSPLQTITAGQQRTVMPTGVPFELGTIPFFAGGRFHPLGPPVKDTRMLCLECLMDQGSHAWDIPHGMMSDGSIIYDNVPVLCPHEVMHSGTAIAQWLNQYYGGSLTQDEINFALFYSPTRSPEGDLGHGQVPDVSWALSVAISQVDTIGWVLDLQTSQDWLWFQQKIDAGIPFVAQLPLKGGVMTGPVVLMGYIVLDPYGTPLEKILFVSPLMLHALQVVDVDTLSGPIPLALSPLEAPGGGRSAPKTDPDVARDTEGDGLYDYDELWRFATDKTQPDSDGDGIKDKTEVWSYKFGRGWAPRTADPDGDGFRAESDPDTDGDGCLDGEEDRNHNGSLYGGPFGIVLKVREMNETDPFWVDEFKVTLSADRTTLHFKEQTHLKVEVADKDDLPLQDVMIRLRMDPEIGTFGAAGGPPVQTLLLQTDREGKATGDFSALETEGTVTLEARYMPCPQGKESKAELKINILPYDWIFAVQEKAVLTGQAVTNPYAVTSSSSYGLFEVEGWHSIYRKPGLQKVSGRFYHPETQMPGKYIQTITVASAPSVVLRINGMNVSGLTWTRASDQDVPTRWEVEVASPGLEQLPLYLGVSTRGGPSRRTPLVWWRSCGIGGSRQRTVAPLTEGGANVLTFDRVLHSYSFFFGDAIDGYDSDFTWPDNVHTKVSFIPRVNIDGHGEGTGAFEELPRIDGSATSGVYFYYDIFRYTKNDLRFVRPTLWTKMFYPDEVPNFVDEVTNLGPMNLGTFISSIRFERDYIGNELQELQQRQITPPEYEIQMLTEE